MTARSKLYLKGSDDEFWLLGSADEIISYLNTTARPFLDFSQVPYLPGEDPQDVWIRPSEVAAVAPLDDREYEHGLNWAAPRLAARRVLSGLVRRGNGQTA